jgi:hypothetical protein
MTSREPAEPAVANPAAAADVEQHARQEIAAVEAAVARRVWQLVRWLAVPAGARNRAPRAAPAQDRLAAHQAVCLTRRSNDLTPSHDYAKGRGPCSMEYRM